MKTYASISLDLDNQWAYLKTHGDPAWEDFPSYFDRFVPHVLEILDQCDIKITFFVVGKDASLDCNEDYLNLITRTGHEMGNHSYKHEVWLHKMSKAKIRSEILKSDELISNVTGIKPIGFRGPGFVWSPKLLGVLHECGYRYDASILPTFLNPLVKWYYFRTTNLTKMERRQRKDIFGQFSDGFKTVKPFYWEFKPGSRLLEMPVTTIPIFKLPFHMSYLLYLSRVSKKMMYLYLYLAIFLCKMTGTEPSFLLHPLDIISGDKLTDLKFFPGMNLSGERKVELFINIIRILKSHFKLVNMSAHMRSIEKNALKIVRV